MIAIQMSLWLLHLKQIFEKGLQRTVKCFACGLILADNFLREVPHYCLGSQVLQSVCIFAKLRNKL